jgi:dTDP-4-amino-4,6-dideoxygalactose transaminase
VSPDLTRGPSPLGAAMLIEQLGLLSRYQDRVRRYAAQYLAVVAAHPELRPPPAAVLAGNLNFLPLLCRPARRHAIAAQLAAHGVETTWLYYPLHRVGKYAAWATPGSYPRADAAWRETMCVPCRGWHRPRQIARVRNAVRDVVGPTPGSAR